MTQKFIFLQKIGNDYITEKENNEVKLYDFCPYNDSGVYVPIPIKNITQGRDINIEIEKRQISILKENYDYDSLFEQGYFLVHCTNPNHYLFVKNRFFRLFKFNESIVETTFCIEDKKSLVQYLINNSRII